MLALTAAYNDLDKPGAVAAAREKYAHVRPTLTVITGRVPHERAQEWRRLTEPATDPAAWRALLEGMAHAMGGDTQRRQSVARHAAGRVDSVADEGGPHGRDDLDRAA